MAETGPHADKYSSSRRKLLRIGCIGLVLYLDSAKHRHALDHERLCWLSRVGLEMTRLVGIPAKNSHAVHRNKPVFRNDDFASAEKCVGLDHGSVALHVRMAEINLVTAKHGEQPSALEVLGVDVALCASKNVRRV